MSAPCSGVCNSFLKGEWKTARMTAVESLAKLDATDPGSKDAAESPAD
ncbi:hypothetical protein [Mycolicibacterium pulveris]